MKNFKYNKLSHAISMVSKKWLIGSLGVAALALVVPAQSFAAIVDGRVAAGEYSSAFDLTFKAEKKHSSDFITTDSSGNAFNGKLFTTMDTNNFWVALVVGDNLNDNTYGSGKSANWNTTGHSFDDLLKSDMLEMTGTSAITIDYLKLSSGTYKANVDSGPVVEAASSLEYNLAHTAITNDAPHTADLLTNSSLDPDWIREVIYEFKIAKDQVSGTGTDMENILALIRGSTVHMSPNMSKGLGGGNKTFINTITPTGPTSPPLGTAPEPGMLALLAAGLMGMTALRRRKQV